MLRMTINNTEYSYFSNLRLTMNFSGFVSTFSFNAPFDPDMDMHRSLFTPLRYPVVKIYYNRELLLTGVIVSHSIQDEAKPTSASFSGYSKCGILQDVSVPTSLYPLQSTDRTLREIVNRLIGPFNLKAIYNAPEVDERYQETVAEQADTVGAYIHKLCEQRNLRLSHSPDGNLVISKPVNSGIFTNFTDRFRALKSEIDVDGQSIYSSYAAIRQSSIEDDVQAQSEATFPIPYRPTVQVQQDGEQGDIEKMATSMRANGGNSLKLNLKLDRWTNYDNEIYKPGYVVGFQNKHLGLRKLNTWFIESVNLYTEGSQEMSDLALVPDWSVFDKKPNNPFE